MLQSLAEKDPSAKVFVFPFDKDCESSLRKLNLSFVQIVSLAEFETEDLLAVKKERSKGEYCWTCTPWIIRHCIEKFSLDHCTYIDADLYFYSNPQVLLDEAVNSSVLITEHRYTPEYDQSATSGIYCVQFVFFRNDSDGLKVLHWWADRCLEWCYSRFEDGKFGDQKYLDHWTTEFNRVHVLKHLGGGVAPWNVQQYELVAYAEQNIILEDKRSKQKFSLVFYHFHDVKIRDGKLNYISDFYEISKAFYLSIYSQYTNELEKEIKGLKEKKIQTELPGSLLDDSISSLLYKRSVYSGLLTETYLYHVKTNGQFIEVSKSNFSISSTFENFQINLPLYLTSDNNKVHLFLLPAKGISLEVQIDQLLVTVKQGLNSFRAIPVSLGIFSSILTGNWQRRKGNAFSFYSVHGYFELKLSCHAIEKIELIGKWRSINPVEAASEISKLNILNRILKKIGTYIR